MDDSILSHLKTCDEIWHAGDFGTIEVVNQLSLIAPIKGVYGNIDGPEIRSRFPETLHWKCEEVNVMMKHIGGYPPNYTTGIKKEIKDKSVQLFISGHSHILKIMYDSQLKCLHLNPGAAGKQGWHRVKTIIRFVIEEKEIKNCEVVELPK
jgi:putative phosphoesterase